MKPKRTASALLLATASVLAVVVAGCGDPDGSSKPTTRPASVTEAVDPNCHMTVPVGPSTPRAEVGGKTYYFCSDDCRDAFLRAQPRSAATAPAARP